LSNDVVLVVVQSHWDGDHPRAFASHRSRTVFRTEIQLVRLPFVEENGLRLELPLTMTLGNMKVTGSRPPRDYRNTGPFTHDESAERIVYLVIADQFLFISVQKLLHILSDYGQTAPAMAPPHRPHLRWSEWGPDATFWFPTQGIFSSWVAVDGARFIALSSYRNLFSTDKDGYVTSTKLNLEPGSHNYTKLLMLDFNPRPIIRDKKQGEDNKQHRSERVREWRARSPLFNGEVISRLPFRVFQGQLPGTPLAVIVDMDHLVVTTVRFDSGERTPFDWLIAIRLRCYAIYHFAKPLSIVKAQIS
jgi:hypothetical protein